MLCYSNGCVDCVPQAIKENDTIAYGALESFNATSEQECQDYCLRNLKCVAIDIDMNIYPLKCWPHFIPTDIEERNLYEQAGSMLFIPVKRCIATLYCKKLDLFVEFFFTFKTFSLC